MGFIGMCLCGFHYCYEKNNTRCSESALQLRLDFSFMVFKQFTLGSESLGLDQDVIFQETDQLVEDFSLD